MSLQSELLNDKILEEFEDLIPDKGTRQILISALDVFAKKGLAAAKVRDIAANAGFSQGFIYNYFKSKDDIFTMLVDISSECAGAMIRNASELEGTPYEKIAWLTEALLSPGSITLQHWRLIMIQAATSDAVPEEAKQISKEKMKKPFEYLIPIITEGQAEGQIVDENPLVLAVTYFSIIQGLGITRVQGGKDMPFPSTDRILGFMRNNVQH